MESVSTMGSGTFGREIELGAVINEIEGHLGTSVEPNFTSSGMVTFRLLEDGPAYTIYRKGTFQIRGAKTEKDLRQALNRLLKLLRAINFDISGYEFRHVTSVFVEDIEHEINLEKLIISLGMELTEYEPEQFPGLIYRPQGHDVTLLIFSSGKVTIGGTTDREVAKSAIQNLKKNISDMYFD